jgi:type I restriction enzyme S subunit
MNFENEGIPFLRIQNLFGSSAHLKDVLYVSQETHDALNRSKIKPGDFLITIAGTIGRVAIVPDSFPESNCNQAIAILRFDKLKLHPTYLLHWLTTNDANAQISGKKVTATISNLSLGQIKLLEIPLPPLAEQKRIAAILDKADTIRRKRQQAIHLADDFLRAVFLDMFGDPNSNSKDWDLATLGDLIEFTKDGPHVSPKYSESGIPFLSTRHVKPTGVVWEDLKYVSQEEADLHWKKCKPQKGDILYTKGGTTGIACPVSFEKDFAVWVHVALVRPKVKLVNYIWLTHMLNTKYCYEQSQQLTRGATNKDLGLKRMVDIKMFAPPIEEQVKFVNLRNKVWELLSKFDDSGAYNFFESLSQKAFAGKL